MREHTRSICLLTAPLFFKRVSFHLQNPALKAKPLAPREDFGQRVGKPLKDENEIFVHSHHHHHYLTPADCAFKTHLETSSCCYYDLYLTTFASVHT